MDILYTAKYAQMTSALSNLFEALHEEYINTAYIF